MISNVIMCRGFALCTGYLAPNAVLKNPNREASEVNQAVYVLSGNAVATSKNKQPIVLGTAAISDVYDFMGDEITYTAGPNGLAWIALNPIPETKKYQTQLVQAGSSVEIASDGAECAVICLFGSVNIGDKTIGAQNYARILPTKTVMVEVPQNSTALIIKAI